MSPFLTSLQAPNTLATTAGLASTSEAFCSSLFASDAGENVEIVAFALTNSGERGKESTR